MEENEELGMSMFDSDSIELNLDGDPEEIMGIPAEEEQEENITDESEEELSEENENISEDQEDLEEVAEDEDENEGGDENDSPNLYSSLASVLHEQGLLPSFDLQNSKIKTVDDIASAFKAESDNIVKTKLVEALGEDGYDAIMKGIPLTDLAKSREAQGSLDTITDEVLESDPELSKRVIYQDYINQGIPEDRAKKMLKRIIDSGEEALLEDAAESLQSLKLFEQKQLDNKKLEFQKQRENEAKAQEQLETELKNKIYNSQELVKGVKLNKAMQDKVYKSMTEIVGKNEDGILENKLMRDRRSNPVDFDAKLYYMYELTNGFKDFSKVTNTTRSSAISDLERSMRQTRHQDPGTPMYMQDGESYMGIGDELVL